MLPVFPNGGHIPEFGVPSTFKPGKKGISLGHTSFSVKI